VSVSAPSGIRSSPVMCLLAVGMAKSSCGIRRERDNLRSRVYQEYDIVSSCCFVINVKYRNV
jgi:hypothetical protein